MNAEACRRTGAVMEEEAWAQQHHLGEDSVERLLTLADALSETRGPRVVPAAAQTGGFVFGRSRSRTALRGEGDRAVARRQPLTLVSTEPLTSTFYDKRGRRRMGRRACGIDYHRRWEERKEADRRLRHFRGSRPASAGGVPASRPVPDDAGTVGMSVDSRIRHQRPSVRFAQESGRVGAYRMSAASPGYSAAPTTAASPETAAAQSPSPPSPARDAQHIAPAMPSGFQSLRPRRAPPYVWKAKALRGRSAGLWSPREADGEAEGVEDSMEEVGGHDTAVSFADAPPQGEVRNMRLQLMKIDRMRQRRAMEMERMKRAAVKEAAAARRKAEQQQRIAFARRKLAEVSKVGKAIFEATAQSRKTTRRLAREQHAASLAQADARRAAEQAAALDRVRAVRRHAKQPRSKRVMVFDRPPNQTSVVVADYRPSSSSMYTAMEA